MEKEDNKNWANRKEIEFYRAQGEFSFLSNFHKSPFEDGGRHYRTNQHYYQSKKFTSHQYQNIICEAETPAEAFRLGQNRNAPIREDWNQVKEQIMLDGLRLKFTRHEQLAKKLIATGEAKLIEHTRKDSYWADGGGKGKGQNKLGLLLMRVRGELRNGLI